MAMPRVNDQDLNEILEPLIKRGMAEMSAERFDKAIRTFRRCIEIAPLRQDVRDLLAMALDNRKPDEPQAEKDEEDWDDIEELVDESSPPSEIKLETKKSYVRLPAWLMVLTVLLCIIAVGSLWIFFRYQDEIPEFWARLKTLNLPEHVVDARRYYADGIKRVEAQDYEGAITLFKQAIETNPAEGAEYSAMMAHVYIALGERELDEKKYQEALTSFKEAASADPDSADAWFFIGLCQHSLALDARRRNRPSDEFYEESVEALERALEIDEGHTQAMVRLMDAYSKLARLREMRDICWDIIEKMPNEPEAKEAKKILGSYGFPERRPTQAAQKTPPQTSPQSPNPKSSDGG